MLLILALKADLEECRDDYNHRSYDDYEGPVIPEDDSATMAEIRLFLKNMFPYAFEDYGNLFRMFNDLIEAYYDQRTFELGARCIMVL